MTILTYTAENHQTKHFVLPFLMNFDYHCGEVCRNRLFDKGEHMDSIFGQDMLCIAGIVN